MTKRCENDECRAPLVSHKNYKFNLNTQFGRIKPILCEMCADNLVESIKSTGKAVLMYKGKRLVFKDDKKDQNFFSFHEAHELAKSSKSRRVT